MKLLHLEDSHPDAHLARMQLESELPGCEITLASTKDEYVGQLRRGGFDVILSDFGLMDFDGFEALALAQKHAPGVPFIFLSGTIGEERAIAIMRAGAQDYVLKDRPWGLATAVQRALREAEADRRLREQAQLLDRASEAIYVTDVNDLVTFWNPAAERTFGWSAAEAIGRPASEVFRAADESTLRRANETLARTGEWHGEIAVLHKNGQRRVLETGLTVIRKDGSQRRACLSVSTDVTEQKVLEEKFLRAQRLESIGMLATGIAHDLNNVLAPVLLGVTMLRERGLDEDVMKVLGSLERSAERGASLVRQILGFAHGIGGEHRTFEIRHLLRDVAGVARETFPRSIRVEQEVERHLWPIHANPTQVHQVLLNLVVNARDAMPDGGVLRLTAENRVVDAATAASIEEAQPGSYLRIQVEDTGTGIPPDVLQRIWEPFFTTKGPGKGTGLGLPTVRGIVRNHSGFITIDTQAGRGTTFGVYLPAAEDAAEGEPPGEEIAAPRGDNELILIVDDEAQVRELVTSILTQHGYRVLAARDGVEAVAIFAPRCSELGLIISDLQMPNLDGAALAAIVRRLNPATKLIAASGLNQPGPMASHPLAKLADAILPKPFKTESLLRSVHRLLHPEEG